MLYPRDILLDIQKVFSLDEFIILTGARQTGKTSVLILLKNNLEEQGRVCHYFNLENPDYFKSFNDHPFNIFEHLPVIKSKQFVFIDEIQYLDDPTNFLKLLYDEKRDKIKIIASGSSAFYIDRKFKDSLVGRKFLFEIYPLNFTEFIIFNNQETLLNQMDKRLNRYYMETLLKLWRKYLIYGGYPKVALQEQDGIKKILLEEIGSSYIKKDIMEAGIKRPDKYFFLLKILAGQTGALLNSQELAHTLGMTYKTIDEYLYIMRKSYQIALITPFYRNLRKELTKMPKVYFYDAGLRNFFLDKNYNEIPKRLDKGPYLENIAFRELLNITKSVDKIKFWRTQDKKEVDFIVENKAYEIKFYSKGLKKKKYERFRKEYPEIQFNILSYKDLLKHFYHWKFEN
jgi:predicted AAA+ superfamily ATPase